MITPEPDTAESDAPARTRALAIDASFLVQAPAGSGKTGLLIQRVLALLARVEAPERILAMTFTRKAAAEMRERVLLALRQAHLGVPVDPADEYATHTRSLAEAALAQDARGDWRLLDNPSRLRMVTIDALSAAFARQAPVTTGLGALPAFVEDAGGHFREAVTTALRAASADEPSWRSFLGHVDNDASNTVELLADMLAKRDQWRGRLPLGAPDPDTRAKLESALCHEISAALERIETIWPRTLASSLLPIALRAAECFETGGDATRAAAMSTLVDFGCVPPTSLEAVSVWLTLANWMLTQDGQFRRRWLASDGFPAAGKLKGEEARIARQAKDAMAEWITAAQAVPGLEAALQGLRELPPARYSEDAWAFVAATLTLLPTLAAQLQLVFARSGETDFSEATLRALTALGDADDPGDLLLATDLSLSHILVDEFQDTSWAHLELIARLTSGWSYGDGRTLFAVGDPMQSIYRFREAEVAIFLEAQSRGKINGIDVECLRLTRNFRSQRPVVEWINSVFPTVLGEISDAARGEVGYASVMATRGQAGDPVPTVEWLADAHEEAARVVAHVQSAQREGAAEIAILVQARTRLALILPALRRSGIAFAAVDLEPLSERLATRDLLNLTRAITQPADTIAGLALLRAPWCGLTLADLLVIAQRARTGTVLDVVDDDEALASLSPRGRSDVLRLRTALRPALAARGRLPLEEVVRAAWLALGGPAALEGDIDIDGAARYFDALAEHAQGGDLPDWDDFANVAGKLYAEAASATPGSVQVMTLHKAKGLEFDTVILPGLARGTRSDGSPALRWRLREQASHEQVLLVAPRHARTGARITRDGVYEYLKSLDADESKAELARLMYVGCTRAKRRLHLLAMPKIKVDPKTGEAYWGDPPAHSPLARLWPALVTRAEPAFPPAVATTEVKAVPQSPPLLRLPQDWRVGTPPSPLVVLDPRRGIDSDAVPFDWAQATAAAIGTVAHQLLAEVARDGRAAWTPARLAASRSRISVALAAEGVAGEALATATERVVTVLTRTLADVRGRWLFDPAHDDARSEWALAGMDANAIIHVTLDRSFVAEGVRWIVDFKTGRHEGGDTLSYLEREEQRYRPQLDRYARILRGLDARPIRLGLYFPLVEGGWREWGSGPAATP